VDPDAILATDGSIEGLFTSLSMRPGRPSIFLRDEFSGLLDSITKKDYYAGMAETLTKLYDGKFQKRVLRKEVIEVRDPVLIFFAGGIKTRIMSLLNYEHVASGFLPRFVMISAESDVNRLRPLGPPTDESIGFRNSLVQRIGKLASHYHASGHVAVEGKVINTQRVFGARLTQEAWERYNKFEQDLLEGGLGSDRSDILTPTFDRMAKSGLKAATLIAASRKLADEVVVEVGDLVKAFYYIEQWRPFTTEVVNGLGKTIHERQLELIHGAIERKPGILRSQLMRTYHLSSRDTDAILLTLDQRGQITRTRTGRTERLYPIT
jgi:hypothetical protein